MTIDLDGSNPTAARSGKIPPDIAGTWSRLEGNLEKKGSDKGIQTLWSSWDMRRFVLEDGLITYWKDVNDQHPNGRILITPYVKIQLSGKGKQQILVVEVSAPCASA